MKSKPSVVFACPDTAEPAAGVRLLLRHHQVLSANGWNSRIVASGSRGLSRWVDGDTELHPDDPEGAFIRVVLEEDQKSLERPGRKVVLAQNVDSIPAEGDANAWRDAGVEAVLAVSDHVRLGVESRFGMVATVVRPSVDRATFRPRQKVRAIAYHHHRSHPDASRILDLCRVGGFDPVPIHELPLARVGDVLSRTAIFLATGPKGEFPITALEAMASACVVVGFGSEGGKEFMEDGSNCLLVPHGDSVRAAHTLELAMRLFDEGRVGDLTENALETARRFSPGREAADLIRFWTDQSNASTGHRVSLRQPSIR